MYIYTCLNVNRLRQVVSRGNPYAANRQNTHCIPIVNPYAANRQNTNRQSLRRQSVFTHIQTSRQPRQSLRRQSARGRIIYMAI